MNLIRDDQKKVYHRRIKSTSPRVAQGEGNAVVARKNVIVSRDVT